MDLSLDGQVGEILFRAKILILRIVSVMPWGVDACSMIVRRDTQVSKEKGVGSAIAMINTDDILNPVQGKKKRLLLITHHVRNILAPVIIGCHGWSSMR